jgi:DNA end-binding protein Ku
LLGTTLRYAYEVRNANISMRFRTHQGSEGHAQLAEHIPRCKTGDFDPNTFVDHYEEAVVEMLKHKQAGAPVSKQTAAAPASNVVNLMDRARRSVAQEKRAGVLPRRRRAPRPLDDLRRQPQSIPDRGRQLLSRRQGCAASSKAKPAQIGVTDRPLWPRGSVWSAQEASSAR